MTVKLPEFQIKNLNVINEGNKLATFSVAFDSPSGLFFSDLRLLSGKHGHFIGMPSRRKDSGEYYPLMGFEEQHGRLFTKQCLEKVVPEYERLSAEEETEPMVADGAGEALPF